MQFVNPELAFLLMLKGTDIFESRLMFYSTSVASLGLQNLTLICQIVLLQWVSLLCYRKEMICGLEEKHLSNSKSRILIF